MPPLMLAILITACRTVVGVLLLFHARAFRRQFQADILNDVTDDIRRAATTSRSRRDSSAASVRRPVVVI